MILLTKEHFSQHNNIITMKTPKDYASKYSTRGKKKNPPNSETKNPSVTMNVTPVTLNVSQTTQPIKKKSKKNSIPNPVFETTTSDCATLVNNQSADVVDKYKSIKNSNKRSDTLSYLPTLNKKIKVDDLTIIENENKVSITKVVTVVTKTDKSDEDNNNVNTPIKSNVTIGINAEVIDEMPTLKPVNLTEDNYSTPIIDEEQNIAMATNIKKSSINKNMVSETNVNLSDENTPLVNTDENTASANTVVLSSTPTDTEMVLSSTSTNTEMATTIGDVKDTEIPTKNIVPAITILSDSTPTYTENEKNIIDSLFITEDVDICVSIPNPIFLHEPSRCTSLSVTKPTINNLAGLSMLDTVMVDYLIKCGIPISKVEDIIIPTSAIENLIDCLIQKAIERHLNDLLHNSI